VESSHTAQTMLRPPRTFLQNHQAQSPFMYVLNPHIATPPNGTLTAFHAWIYLSIQLDKHVCSLPLKLDPGACTHCRKQFLLTLLMSTCAFARLLEAEICCWRRCRISEEVAVLGLKSEGEESGEEGGAKSVDVGVVWVEASLEEELEELDEPPKKPIVMGSVGRRVMRTGVR
jgi:hypothetical protein